jgi:hypothetical protein
MPYQGNTPVESYIATVKDSFNGNGSTTAFTMSKPTQVNDVRVVVENVIQDPSVAYTVSGTTITFTSAPPSGTNNIYVIHLGPAVATAQPPAEIADATTFASNVSVQGSFTSPGIDDNADATALTIDSSEVVLVGKTSNTFSQQGVALRANNDSQITRDGGNPLSLNRTSSDGAIAKFFKDGTEVGSIGVQSTDQLYIATPDGSGVGLIFDGDNRKIDPTNGAGSNLDNAVDLGTGAYRFKDLYLSGGVYLGGTGSANKLDDYEYGSWTPTTPNAGSVTPNNAVYTKIGDQVTIWCLLTDFSDRSSATSLTVKGLPFNSTNSGVAVGTCMCQYVANTVHTIYMAPNSGLQFYKSENGGGFVVLNHSDLQNSAAQIYLMATYTAS